MVENKRYKIYKYLIEGYYPGQIAKHLKIDKGYVSKVIKQLEQGGYIQCINPDGKPKFYAATKKPFKATSKLTKQTPDKLTRLRHRRNIVEVQKCSFKFKLLSEPQIQKWDRVWSIRGVKFFQYAHPFENFGNIIFRRAKGSSEDNLIIILPRILIEKPHLKHVERILTDFAVKAGNWFQKRFKCRLGLPEMAQKPHFAVPIKEPSLIPVLQKSSFKVRENIFADSSPPDLIPEFESTDFRDVVNYLEGIEKVKFLEDKLSIVEKRVDDVEKIIERSVDELSKAVMRTNEAVARLAEQISMLTENINRLVGNSNIDRKPPSPDDREVV